MEISFLGGAREVGGSCIFVEISGKRILLDCGIRQTSSKDPIPDFRSIQEKGGVDAIIVSHAHMDHIGCLPIISKEYPKARIYSNVMTKDIMRVLLYDSLKIMKNREEEIPLYAENDVIAMLNRVFPINYMVEYPLFDNIKICFYGAGHIGGASCIYIKSDEGSIFYSGDFSIFSQKTVEGLKVPKLRPDVGIFETTYGDRLHSNREVEEERLISMVNECVSVGGKMLIPAFALGRAQEIILIIKRAINKGNIKGVKVYVDGMIRDVNRVYKLNPLYLKNSLAKKILRGIEPFYDENIIPVKDREMRKSIIESGESCVIISSSGMLTGGFSQCYAEKLAPLENSYIVITGYQDEESPGRKLLQLLDENDRQLELNGRSIPVRCKVHNVGLSAHSDKAEIKSLIELLSPRNIFMVHGNESVIEKFSLEISREARARVYSPRCGESYSLNIYKPRKQIKKKLEHTMQDGGSIKDIDLKRLWSFIIRNYGERFFTVEEIAFLWTGDQLFMESSDKFDYAEHDSFFNDIHELQVKLVESVYFESNSRRLFLFKPRDIYDVNELLKPRELKPNEIKELVDKYFSAFKFKKAGFMYDRKTVVLSFNFPLAVDHKIYKTIDDFEKAIKWKVEISSSTNTNEISKIIVEFLNDENIKKISFKLDMNIVEVLLRGEVHVDNSVKSRFYELTGLELSVKFACNIQEDSSFKSVSDDNRNLKMEQNMALSIIDQKFETKKFKPYKKSIKSCQNGKYIELAFITNIIGKKCQNEVDELRNITGWNIQISESANQNSIISILNSICNLQNAGLVRNPSFNRQNLTASIKFNEPQTDEKIEYIKREFKEKTGCSLIVII